MGNLKAAQKQIADDMKYVGGLLDRLHSAPADVPSWLVIQIHASIRRALEVYHNGDPYSEPEEKYSSTPGMIKEGLNIANLARARQDVQEGIRRARQAGTLPAKFEPNPGPGFKAGQWVHWSSLNILVQVIDPYDPRTEQCTLKVKGARVSDSNEISWIPSGSCRPATPEEMFKVGARVRWKDDSSNLIVEGEVLDSVSHFIDKIRIRGIFPDSGINPSDLELIEPAPKEK